MTQDKIIHRLTCYIYIYKQGDLGLLERETFSKMFDFFQPFAISIKLNVRVPFLGSFMIIEFF